MLLFLQHRGARKAFPTPLSSSRTETEEDGIKQISLNIGILSSTQKGGISLLPQEHRPTQETPSALPAGQRGGIRKEGGGAAQ